MDRGRNTDPLAASAHWVTLGRISGVYGVKGWVRIYSHTQPRERILDYAPWRIGGGDSPFRDVLAGRRHGKGVVARIEGIDDRDAAAQLIDAEIAVPRDRLAAAAPGEYYWADLEGLEVATTDGRVLGTIEHLFETGANDVMVVSGDKERLIPFAEPQIVRQVDLDAGRVVVDWDPEF